MKDNMIEKLLKRDRLIIIIGLFGVILVAWVYTLSLMRGFGLSDIDPEIIFPHTHAWTRSGFFLNFLMWTVMQVAMMTPTAVPMLLFYTKITRQRYPERSPYFRTGIFLLGYLVVWAGFSLIATVVQWGLHQAALLTTDMVQVTPIMGGALLIAAGVFQFSSVKNACLTHCRSPVGFIMTEWKEGRGGTFLMGIKHGGYCVGCCWLLMALLFVAGVMNLLWMAVITVIVLVEKLAPAGDRIGKGAGVLFILWGGWMIFFS
jgi:predicted metal-binding membrane protein